MAHQEDLDNARDYLTALIRGDDPRMNDILGRAPGQRSSAGERDPAGIINALGRMVLLQAGPRADVEEYIDRLVRTLAAIRPYASEEG